MHLPFVQVWLTKYYRRTFLVCAYRVLVSDQLQKRWEASRSIRLPTLLPRIYTTLHGNVPLCLHY